MNWEDLIQAKNAAKIMRSKLAGVNPELFLPTVSAALLAPAFISNDDRGYFKSAAITTPLVAAAYLAAPRLSQVFKEEIPKTRNLISGISARVYAKGPKTYQDIVGMQSEVFNGNVRPSLLRSATRSFYQASPKVSFLDSQINQLSGALPNVFKNINQTRQLENLVHSTLLETLPAAGVSDYLKKLGDLDFAGKGKGVFRGVAPKFGKTELERMIGDQIAARNEPFIKAMNFGLQKINKTTDRGVSETGHRLIRNSKDIEDEENPFVSYTKPNERINLSTLESNNPLAHAALQNQLNNGHISLKDLRGVYKDRGNTQNDLIALYVKDSLYIPIQDARGNVITGKFWDRTAIARKAVTSSGVAPSDVWAINALSLGPERYKDIEKDLTRMHITRGVDYTEDWNSDTGSNEWEYSDNESALAKNLRRKRAVEVETAFKDGRDQSELRPHEAENFIDKVEGFGLTKVGPEKMNGVWEESELSQLAYFGSGGQDPFRQNSRYRGLSKDTRLVDITHTKQSTPYAVTSYLEDLAEGEQLPIVGVQIGGVSSRQRTFMAELPDSVAGLKAHTEKAVSFFKEHYTSGEGAEAEQQARQYWKEYSKWLSNPKNLAATKLASTLGEGSKLGPQNLYGTSTARNRTFEVDELHLNANDQMYGKALQQDTLIGFVNGKRIVTESPDYHYISHSKNERGMIRVEMQEKIAGFDGAKIDPDISGRGLVTSADDNMLERFGRSVSKFNEITGTGAPMHSATKIFELYEGGVGKGNINDLTVNLTSAAIRRAEEMGQHDIIDKFMPKLAPFGFSLRKGDLTTSSQLVQDTSMFLKNTKEKNIALNLRNQKVVDELLTAVGDRIKRLAIANPSELSETGRKYASVAGRMSFRDYMMLGEAPANATVWSHTNLDAPKRVKVTTDVLQQLNLSGDHATIKELLSGAVNDEEVSITKNFAKYTSGEDTSVITKTISMREALGGKANKIDLTSGAGRAGTIFDPAHPLAQDNFLISLPDGSVLPKLGSQGVGGKINRYEGTFSIGAHERHELNIFKAYEQGKPAEEIAKLKALRDESLLGALYGKESFTRNVGYYPAGQGGFFVSRDSPLRMSNGEINPFGIGVSEDFLERSTKTVRQALEKGEEVGGLIQRYPTHKPVRGILYLDRSLGKNQHGIDPTAAAQIDADIDKDGSFVFPFEPGSDASNEMIAQAKEGSSQHISLAEHMRMQPEVHLEKPRGGGATVKSYKDRVVKLVKSINDTTQIQKQKLISRTTGQFSNAHQMLLNMVELNSENFSQREVEKLNHLFFEPKQTPITAVKHELASKFGFKDMTDAHARLIDSMEPEAGFDEFKSAFNRVLQFSPKSVQDSFAESEDLLRRVHAGRPDNLLQITKAQTSNVSERINKNRIIRSSGREAGVVTQDIKSSIAAADMLSYTSAAKVASTEASTGARMASEAIGAANEGIATAERVAKAFRGSEASKALGIGLGIAALAGFMTTTVSSPKNSRSSLNKFRPEHVANTSDHIPGEGVSGSHSSNPPKVRVSNDTPNVNRGYVVPIQQSSDVEVHMKTDDPSRATETAKMVARSAGSGQTIVTNNYSNNNLTSLRNKQKLRDRLDESS